MNSESRMYLVVVFIKHNDDLGHVVELRHCTQIIHRLSSTAGPSPPETSYVSFNT